MKSWATLLIFGLAGTALAADALDSEKKNGRSFSIFSVVQFGNSLCVASSSTTSNTVFGTCYTTSECMSNGGTASGSCASGFGVCCVITQSTCGSTISKNVTYIQNPGFPSGITATGTCTYTLSTTSDICQLRLDFVNFVTANPDGTGLCATGDRLTVLSSSGSGNGSPPVTCGTLTGSHMYVETGRNANTGATLTIANAAATSPARTWQIRVTQIECGSPAKAPTDCLQYYTGIANNIKSLNFQNGAGQFLKSMNYYACIRQEEGFCTIQYRQNDAATITTFKLTNQANSKTDCAGGPEIVIPSTAASGTDTYCGGQLNSVTNVAKSGAVFGTTVPFDIQVFSDTATSTSGDVGFFINYNQIPC